MTPPAHVGSMPFALAVTSAFYHRDPLLRTELREMLGSRLTTLGKLPEESRVRDVVEAQNGTDLEPFVLQERDIDCVVLLARAFFSEVVGGTRFRIVSRDSIGADGGLVITNNLASYFVERFAGKPRQRQPLRGLAFVPELIPGDMNVSLGPVRFPQWTLPSQIVVADDGIGISVDLPNRFALSAEGLRAWRQKGGLEGVPETLDSLGLRLECSAGRLHCRTGSPESMIRFMAHCARGASLFLPAWQESAPGTETPALAIKLVAPTDAPQRLCAFASGVAKDRAWLTGTGLPACILSANQKLRIMDWLAPPPQWLPLLLEN